MIKNNFKILILIFATIFMISCKNEIKPTSKKLTSLKGKNILMVYGGWDGHQPAVFVTKVSKWLELAGAKITLSDSLGVYTNKKIMDKTDLIIQYWTMGEITKEQFIG